MVQYPDRPVRGTLGSGPVTEQVAVAGSGTGAGHRVEGPRLSEGFDSSPPRCRPELSGKVPISLEMKEGEQRHLRRNALQLVLLGKLRPAK